LFDHIKNKALIVAGFVSLAIGGIGVFVPLLPTTPLVLLAAYFFARSNRKYHSWLHNNRIFGATVRGWESEKALTIGEKWKMAITATVVIGISFFLCTNIIGKVVLALVWLIPISISIFSKTRR